MLEWLRIIKDKIFSAFSFLESLSLKYTLMAVAWFICLFAVGFSITVVWEYFNLEKMGTYTPGKFITAISNLICLYSSLILFDIAFGGHSTIHGILDLSKPSTTVEEKRNAMYFLSCLAVCSTYLISIGA